MSVVTRLLPGTLKRWVKRAVYSGDERFCPVCESGVRVFRPFGVSPRPDAMCPVCGSLERHRLLWLYFRDETGLFEPPVKKMLHVAPEPCFSERLSGCGYIDYLSADLYGPAMVRMDVTDIQYPDDTFDVIYCSHVLEHVPDDRKAMSEFARVLKPGGWAVIQVPIKSDTTYEAPDVTDPSERERLFGQSDHVRVYGKDYVERLNSAGFDVDVVSYYNSLSDETLLRTGLRHERDDIYICRPSDSR